MGHGAGHGRGQAGWPSSPGGSATGILAHGDAARRHRHGDRALGGGRQCCRLALRLPSRHTRKLGRVVGGCRVGGLHRAAGPLGSGANVSAQKAAGRRGQRSGCSSLRGAGPGAPPETLLPFLAARRCCSWGTAQPLQVPLGGPGEWAGHTRPPGSGQGPDDMAPSSPCPDTLWEPVPLSLGPGWRWLSWVSLPGPPAQAPRCPSNLRSIAARVRPSWAPSWPWSSCCGRQGPRAPWTSSPWPCSGHTPAAS